MIVQEIKTRAIRTQPNDGTRELLRGGGFMVGTGLFAGALLELFLGGMTKTGATTNGGWLALIVALMCLPFGALRKLFRFPWREAVESDYAGLHECPRPLAPRVQTA